ERGHVGPGRADRGAGLGGEDPVRTGVARSAAGAGRGRDPAALCRPGAYARGHVSTRVVLASGNRHKARELGRVLPGFEVEPYAGQLPEETGATFLANARLKARHVHRALHGSAWVLADDSGIAADALD